MPDVHIAKVKEMLTQLIEQAREDVPQVNELKAQALFETSAEVLIGLRKAFDDYEQKNEPGWRKAV